MKGLPNPRISVGIADVRDVALAHWLGLFKPNVNGSRIIVSLDPLWFVDIAKILAEEFNKQGYKVSTREAGYWMLWIAGFFDQQCKLMLPFVGHKLIFDNKNSKELLGLEYQID